MALPELRGIGTSVRHPAGAPPLARSVDVAALYATHSEQLRNVCLRLTRDPSAADDLSQEAFARLIARLPSLSGDVNIAAYLQVTARNLYLNGLRDHSREFADDLIEARIAPDDELERDPTRAALLVEQIDQMRRSTARLNGRQRRALVLREVEGLSYAEIADQLGTSPEAIAQILARARMRLRAEYRREQDPSVPLGADCNATRDALSAYLDLKLAPALHDDVQRHLRQCDACRGVLATYREAGIQLRGAGPLSPIGALLGRLGSLLQGVGHATGTTAAVLGSAAIVAVGAGGVVVAHHVAARGSAGSAATTAGAFPTGAVAAPARAATDRSASGDGSTAPGGTAGFGDEGTQSDPGQGTTSGTAATDTGVATTPDATTSAGTLPVDTGAASPVLDGAAANVAVTTPAITTPAVAVPGVTTPPVATPVITVPPVTVPPVTVPPVTVPAVSIPPATVPPLTLPRL